MPQIEVDEVLRLVGDKATEIPTNNAMPGRTFLAVELRCVSALESRRWIVV